MAKPITGKFSELQILIGDGGSPEEFAVVCGMTTKGVQRSAQTNSTVVPDCEDEDAPAWEEKAVNSLSVTISGSGVWAAENHGVFMDWFYSGQSKNIKVRHMRAAAGTPEYEEGPALLTALNNTVERGNKVQAEVTIEMDGQPSRMSKPGGIAPANTVLPSISGIAIEGGTLTALTGTWSNNPTSYSYAWNRDGTPISGATAATYTLVSDDVGEPITVTVTATNATGSTPATSAPTADVVAA